MKFKASHLHPAIVPADAAEVIHAYGDEVRIHLGTTLNGGAFTMFTDIAPPHYHDAEHEWFYILKGRMSFFTAGKWTEISTGAALFAPRRSVHTFQNIGDTPSQMLVHNSPSGFESFFSAAAAEFSQPGGPDRRRATQIAGEHGIHFVQS